MCGNRSIGRLRQSLGVREVPRVRLCVLFCVCLVCLCVNVCVCIEVLTVSVRRACQAYNFPRSAGASSDEACACLAQSYSIHTLRHRCRCRCAAKGGGREVVSRPLLCTHCRGPIQHPVVHLLNIQSAVRVDPFYEYLFLCDFSMFHCVRGEWPSLIVFAQCLCELHATVALF